MKKIASWSIIIFLAVGFFFTIDYNNTAGAVIINLNSKSNSLSNPVNILLDAGRYILEPIGVNEGGAYNAWNAWLGEVKCNDPNGCKRTCPTTFFGWMHRYDVVSPNLTFVSVNGVLLPPVVEDLCAQSYFLVTNKVVRLRVDNGAVYPDPESALSHAQTSIFSLDSSGVVGFAIDDTAHYDNKGGISLNLSPYNGFFDVVPGYWAEDAIYKIYEAGITTGCSATPLKYCPERTVTRAQMAVFLSRGIHGSNFTPPTATGIFDDVPVGSFAANWIEQFYKDGITGGCGTNPLRYCPENPVTRAQMAVFLLRAKHGSNYTPPTATGIFDDVPVGSFAADWIEQLYNEGITGGCGTNPLRYCPDSSVTRAQMAVFIVKTFGL